MNNILILMNKKIRNLFHAMAIPSIVVVIFGYAYYAYIASSSNAPQGMSDSGSSFPFGLFLSIAIIIWIGWTALMYIFIIDSGYIFSKKKK